MNLKRFSEIPETAGTRLKITMESSIEYSPALGMLDQETRYRKSQPSGLLVQDEFRIYFEPPTNHRMNQDGHFGAPSII